MEGELRNVLVLGYGEYEFDDGRSVPYAVLYDPDGGGEAGFRANISEDCDPKSRPPAGSVCNVGVRATVRQVIKRGKRRDGSEWEMPQSQVALTILGFRK